MASQDPDDRAKIVDELEDNAVVDPQPDAGTDDVEPAFDIDLDPEDQGTADEAAANPD